MISNLLDRVSVVGWLAIWAASATMFLIMNYFFWEAVGKDDRE